MDAEGFFTVCNERNEKCLEKAARHLEYIHTWKWVQPCRQEFRTVGVLDTIWQCAYAAQKPKRILGCIKEMWPQVEEEDSPHLLHSHEIPYEVLHPALYNTCPRLVQCRDLGLKRDCLKKLEECRRLHMIVVVLEIIHPHLPPSHRLEQAVYREGLKCYQTRVAMRQSVRQADSFY